MHRYHMVVRNSDGGFALIRHDDAVRILYFAELEKRAIEDYCAARARGDGAAMMDAARRWERAANYVG
jgi:hypothetical protein